MNKNKGFTLIELMLVVLIMGILAGAMLGIVNIRGIQAKSRDARRVGDIKKMQTALELYFSDYRGYPESESWENINSGLSGTLIAGGYINNAPDDPKEAGAGPEGVSCFGDKSLHGYYYITTNCDGVGCLATKYILGAIMEVETSASDSLCSELNNCVGGSISCSCGGLSCYGAENPL